MPPYRVTLTVDVDAPSPEAAHLLALAPIPREVEAAVLAVVDLDAPWTPSVPLTETGFSPPQASGFKPQRLGACPSFSCLSGAATRHGLAFERTGIFLKEKPFHEPGKTFRMLHGPLVKPWGEHHGVFFNGASTFGASWHSARRGCRFFHKGYSIKCHE